MLPGESVHKYACYPLSVAGVLTMKRCRSGVQAAFFQGFQGADVLAI